MDEVNPAGRQLIQAVSAHDGLDPVRRRQLRDRVMLGVGVASGVGIMTATSQAAATAAPAAAATQVGSVLGFVGKNAAVLKLVFVAAAGGTLGTGVVLTAMSRNDQQESQVAVEKLQASSATALRRHLMERSAVAKFTAPDPETQKQSAVAAPLPSQATAAFRGAQAGVRQPSLEAPEDVDSDRARLPAVGSFEPLSPPATADSSLTNELETLQRAQRDLRDGKGQEVLDSLGRSPRAQVLTEEYAAARVFALCNAGNVVEGRRAAQEFLRRYPRSPSVPRVQRACSGK